MLLEKIFLILVILDIQHRFWTDIKTIDVKNINVKNDYEKNDIKIHDSILIFMKTNVV